MVPTCLALCVAVMGKGDGSGALRGFSSRFPEHLVKKGYKAGSITPTTWVWAVYSDFLPENSMEIGLGSGRGYNVTVEKLKHPFSQVIEVNMNSDEQCW